MRDLKGRLLEVNEAYCNMSGFKEEELLTMSISDLVALETPAETDARDQSMTEHGKARFESQHRRKDGSIFDVEIDWQYKTVDGGKSVVLAKDITDQKLTKKARKVSGVNFQNTFGASPAWVAITTAEEGRWLEVNDAFTDITGYTKEEALGRTSFDLNFWLDPYRDRKEAMDLFKRDGCFRNLEKKMRFKNGSIHTMLWSVDPIEYSGQRCWMNMLIDITGQKIAEERLRQAHKMVALGTLTSGIAHDFNNILVAIMGFSELVQEDLPKGHATRHYVSEITRAASRAKDLVRQILTFARKAKADQKPISLNQLVDNAIAMLERTIPKMIRLEMKLSLDLWEIKADPLQMEQVMLNLVTNAADSLGETGSISVTTKNVEFSNQPCEVCGDNLNGRYVMLSVKDNGSGMSSETKAKIFDPFFTTKEVGKSTGLGLSTVYGIVTGHGGHIMCHSQEGVGTDFQIYFPVADGAVIHICKAAENKREKLHGNETILVVDDEAFVREIVMEILTRHGYQVLQAKNGEEALKVYKENPGKIDGVMMDLGMPGMGGKFCLQEIRKINPDAKVLIASGYIQCETTNELISLGASGMMSKPYMTKELLKNIRQMLDG